MKMMRAVVVERRRRARRRHRRFHCDGCLAFEPLPLFLCSLSLLLDDKGRQDRHRECRGRTGFTGRNRGRTAGEGPRSLFVRSSSPLGVARSLAGEEALELSFSSFAIRTFMLLG